MPHFHGHFYLLANLTLNFVKRNPIDVCVFVDTNVFKVSKKIFMNKSVISSIKEMLKKCYYKDLYSAQLSIQDCFRVAQGL